jgi:hypothetical protein
MERSLVGGAFTKEGHGHTVAAALPAGEGGATRLRCGGGHDAAAAEAPGRVEQVHVAALAAAQAGHLAEHLGRHLRQWHALGDGEVVRPVRADHRVAIVEVRANAHGHRLLPRGQVHFARHRTAADIEGQALLYLGRQLAFEVDLRHGLLVVSNLDHLRVHPAQLVWGRGHDESPSRRGSTTSQWQPSGRR